MFRLIGCQWQWQWQIRVHIQIATSSVVAVALFTRSLSLSVYPCLQTALTSETRAGLGQALELPPICMGCALQPEHLSRLLATHWAKGAMRCGCFSRCKQMPRVYLVRVRMCTGHQAALAGRPCPCCRCRKRRRQRPLGSAECCASCGTRQRNA